MLPRYKPLSLLPAAAAGSIEAWATIGNAAPSRLAPTKTNAYNKPTGAYTTNTASTGPTRNAAILPARITEPLLRSNAGKSSFSLPRQASRTTREPYATPARYQPNMRANAPADWPAAKEYSRYQTIS